MTLVSRVLLALATLIVAFPVFWVAGGVARLDKTVFPPRRPKDMPQNAIWIDAPSLPISWHHGWWFGCETPPSGTANYCRLVEPDGNQVYSGEYLPCGATSPVPISNIALVPPPDEMWIADKRLKEMATIGALHGGDLLLPIAVLDRCDELKNKLRAD
jgi:hypothetical protein